MNVNFFPVNKNKEKTSLQAIVRYKGERYPISVGESIISKFWNAKTHRCRVVREYSAAISINHRLDQWERLIKDIFDEFDVFVVPTNEMVQDAVRRKVSELNRAAGGVIEEDESQRFIVFARKFKQETIRSEGTKNSYTNTINKIEEYEAHFKKKLQFEDIDIDFYYKFKQWLIEQDHAKNYIAVLLKNIKAFMNASRRKKIHSFVGDKDPEFKVEFEEPDAIYLTMSEIEKIYNLEFTEQLLIENEYTTSSSNLQRAIISLSEERDRFLIGCLTALRFSDYSRIDILNFNEDMIGIWTRKKDKKVYIPMHYLLREILIRRNNVFPRKVSEQKHNKHIKMIGRLAGIDEQVMLTKTQGGVRIERIGKKYEFISTHTARRSGATNMYLSGIDVKFIQGILGHKKVEHTLRYIRVSSEENARRLLNHSYFTGNQSATG